MERKNKRETIMSKVRFIIAVADDNGAPFLVLERFHTYDQMKRDYPFVLKQYKGNKKHIRCYQRTITDDGVITTWEIKIK
jgi:hypothetical protein